MNWRGIALAIGVIAITSSAHAVVDLPSAGLPLGDKWQDGLSPRCVPFYGSKWRPALGADRTRPVPSPKPPRGKAFAEGAYKTCVVRVTDHDADGVRGFLRNDYSRRQAFNADGTKLLAYAQDGSWHIYDAQTFAHLTVLQGVGGDAEPQWHPTDPKLLYYIPAFGVGMQLKIIDVTTNKSRVVGDLAARLKKVWPTANAANTRSEGSPSCDGRYWGFNVEDEKWQGLGMMTYDVVKDQIIGTYDYAKHGRPKPDHVSMTPSGKYITVSWEDGVYAFTREFAPLMKLHNKSEHSDLALDAEGNDVFVSIDYDDAQGSVFMVNMKTGLRTDLVPTYLQHSHTAMHFSGKAYARPGWVLISTYAEGGGPWQWLHGKIFAVELKEHPRVIDLAYTHVFHDDYFTEPHASVNRDFTRVVWGSNWDVHTKTDVDIYMIELPRALLTPPHP